MHFQADNCDWVSMGQAVGAGVHIVSLLARITCEGGVQMPAPSATAKKRGRGPPAVATNYPAPRASKKVNPLLKVPADLGGKVPPALVSTKAEKEKEMYIDYKSEGGVCELTPFYKSQREGYSCKHEFIAMTPIDLPPTSAQATTALLDTVVDLMKKCGKAECVLTVDGGEFYRLCQLAHNHPDRYGGIFIMPGGFHLLKARLAAIGARFAGPGLASLWVEAGVCMGDASAKNCESATHFNRSLRAHKLTWEVLSLRLVAQWEAAGSPEPAAGVGGGGGGSSGGSSSSGDSMGQAPDGDLGGGGGGGSSSSATASTGPAAYGALGARMHAARVWAENERVSNKQFDMWVSYLDCVGVALDFTRAMRGGDLTSYTIAARQMCPLLCEYDKGLYQRITTLLLAMLAGVGKTHPTVSAHLNSGHGLSFRRSLDAFTSVAMDLLVEHWNKVCKSPRGFTYCATKPTLRDAWFKSMPELARVHTGLRAFIPPAKLQRSRATKPVAAPQDVAMRATDVTAMARMNELLDRIGCPFEDRSEDQEGACRIRHLTRGIACPDDAATDLCQYLVSGEERFAKFWEERIVNTTNGLSVWHSITFRKSLTMMSGSKNRRGKSKAIVVQTLEHFLKYCAVFDAVKSGEADSTDLTLDLMSEYELGAAPWSMFYETLEMRRPSNKAAMLKMIYPTGARELTINAEAAARSTYVVDFCAALQSTKPDAEMTFGQFVDRCIATCAQQAVYAKCNHLGIICDQYWEASIKNSTRLHRGDSAAGGSAELGPQHDVIVPGAALPKSNFATFLKSGQNKKALLALVGKRMAAATATAVAIVNAKGQVGRIDTIHLLTEGTGSSCTWLAGGSFSEVTPEPRLTCACEEADQGMIAYIKFATTHIVPDNIIVNVADTDVHVALTTLAPKVAGGVQLAATVGKGASQRLVDIHAARSALVSEHGEAFVGSLIGLHVLSGCDTTSSLFGKGKLTFWKLLVSLAMSGEESHKHIVQSLQQLGSGEIEESRGKLKAEVVKSLETFAKMLYGNGAAISLAAIRASSWRAAKSTPATLAPTPKGWLQHVLRAHYQCKIWMVSVEGGDVPEPDGWGWKKTGGRLEPVPFEGGPAPEQLLSKVTCGCGTKTADKTINVCGGGNCNCRKQRPSSHKCTVLCRCDPNRCQNRDTERAESDVEEEVTMVATTSAAEAATVGLEHEQESDELCEECCVAIGEEFEGCWICAACQESGGILVV